MDWNNSSYLPVLVLGLKGKYERDITVEYQPGARECFWL